MKQSDTYKSEVKNFKNDLIENLIDYHIDITDFNVIKPFIIESIESVWKGNVEDLKSYLAEQNQCSVGDIENLLERSNSRNWPPFFRSENNRRSEDFQAKNSLQLGRVVFLDNEREEKRRRFKELKFCVLHHLKRSFECNDTGKCHALYHISRIGLGCCWYSYIWRLVCYNCTSADVTDAYKSDKSNLKNKLCMLCCMSAHVFCFPFHLCYWYDKKNYEPRIVSNEAPAVISGGRTVGADAMVVNEAADLNSLQEVSSQESMNSGDSNNASKNSSGGEEKELDERKRLDETDSEEQEQEELSDVEKGEALSSAKENIDPVLSSQDNLANVPEANEESSAAVDVVDGGNINLAFQENDMSPNENPQLENVTIHQPTKFHYTNKYFQSFLYIAIESRVVTAEDVNREEGADEFYFWIKIPFNFNIDLDDHKDLDLY